MDHLHGQIKEEVESLIPADDDADSVASCFSKLADATRLKIFSILCHSEQCVMGLASLIGMSSPATAHHLKILKDAGLIVSDRRGKEMYYRLSSDSRATEMHKAVDTIFHLTCNR